MPNSPRSTTTGLARKTPPKVSLQVRDLPGPAGFSGMKTADLRAAFLIEDLFVPDELRMVCCQGDRAIIGATVPTRKTIGLPSPRDLAAEYFTQRRELGIVNLGGEGSIGIDSTEILLQNREAAYIGKGNPKVTFSSRNPKSPAQFYFVSYPAHAVYPCAKVDESRMEATECGSSAGANRRTIRKLIHPRGVASCQLSMGVTRLDEGSVWNTMPAHTHRRRSEIYLYFDLPKEGVVVHCMGEPGETRHLIMRDRQVVLSPSWSVHFGAGTSNYSFVWSMGGENQDFADMDAVPMEELL